MILKNYSGERSLLSKMQLCLTCYDKLKDIPNIVKLGVGRACFGRPLCDECGKCILGFVAVEISNKKIEIHSKNLNVPLEWNVK